MVFTVDLRKLYFVSFFFFFFPLKRAKPVCLFVGVFSYLQLSFICKWNISHSCPATALVSLCSRSAWTHPRDAQAGIAGAEQGQGLDWVISVGPLPARGIPWLRFAFWGW